MTNKPRTKASFGGGRVHKVSPPLEQDSCNIAFSFEEALKLNLALQAALHDINRLDLRLKENREMRVLLSLKGERVSVLNERIKDQQ